MKQVLVLSSLLMLMVTPAFAQSRSLDITGWITFVDPSGDNDFEDASDFEDLEARFDSEQGYGLAINTFWSDRISTEFAASVVEPDVTLRATDPSVPFEDVGSLEMIPLTATLQFHFNPEGRLDPYIGAGVAYVLFDEIEGTRFGDIGFDSIDLDDDFGFVVNGGLSFDITPNFAINLDAKYVPVESAARAVVAGADREEVDFEVNPLILAAGLSFQF